MRRRRKRKEDKSSEKVGVVRTENEMRCAANRGSHTNACTVYTSSLAPNCSCKGRVGNDRDSRSAAKQWRTPGRSEEQIEQRYNARRGANRLSGTLYVSRCVRISDNRWMNSRGHRCLIRLASRRGLSISMYMEFRELWVYPSVEARVGTPSFRTPGRASDAHPPFRRLRMSNSATLPLQSRLLWSWSAVSQTSPIERVTASRSAVTGTFHNFRGCTPGKYVGI